MRPSQYNLIENHGERTLVMNAKTGAILSLDKQHAESMCRMVSGTEWEPDELREALLQGGMLLEDDRDEKKETAGRKRHGQVMWVSRGGVPIGLPIGGYHRGTN